MTEKPLDMERYAKLLAEHCPRNILNDEMYRREVMRIELLMPLADTDVELGVVVDLMGALIAHYESTPKLTPDELLVGSHLEDITTHSVWVMIDRDHQREADRVTMLSVDDVTFVGSGQTVRAALKKVHDQWSMWDRRNDS